MSYAREYRYPLLFPRICRAALFADFPESRRDKETVLPFVVTVVVARTCALGNEIHFSNDPYRARDERGRVTPALRESTFNRNREEIRRWKRTVTLYNCAADTKQSLDALQEYLNRHLRVTHI